MQPAIRKEVERRIRSIEKQKTEVTPPQSIADCIARASPHLDNPLHLRPYVEAMETAARTGGVELCFAAPVQHGKTTVTLHALAFFAIVRPGLRHAFCTYNQVKARTELLNLKRICFALGLDPHTRGNILTLAGGTIIQFVGCSTGELTGNPVDGLLVIDDPLRGPEEAYSKTIRESRWTWFVQVAQTRRHPGSSCVVMQSRWHIDDLIGKVTKEFSWEYIRIPAECDSLDDPLGRQIGEALWPEKRPLEWLQQFKRSPVAWQGLYQGAPRAVGDALFQDATFYTTLPAGRYVPLYGADLAYTAKTRADWSVLLHGRWYPDLKQLYLLNELRLQVQADVFTDKMHEKWTKEPGRVLWFGSTTEKGVADLIRKTIPKFEYRQATVDKYVRALPTAEQLWNPGDVMVPQARPWAQSFVEEVVGFSGQGDGVDDRIDALAALGTLCIGIMGAGYSDFNQRLRERKKHA